MNELIPTDPSSDSEAVIRHDNRLNDAVGFLRTIEEGRGSPEDLVNYVELSAGYYVDQLKDPVKAADPVFQEAALHHQIAKTQGGAGLVGFCVAQMQEAVMQGVRMREIRATKTSDRYLTKAQHWARLMGQINLRNIPKPTV